MIDAADVMPLFAADCPTFRRPWQTLQSDPDHIDDDGARRHYQDAGEYARGLVDHYVAGDLEHVRKSFGVIERLHVEGDDCVRELATIGYLEDVQNAAARETACDPEDLLPFLGQELRRCWDGLNDFWAG